jgi:hypothetical protein
MFINECAVAIMRAKKTNAYCIVNAKINNENGGSNPLFE